MRLVDPRHLALEPKRRIKSLHAVRSITKGPTMRFSFLSLAAVAVLASAAVAHADTIQNFNLTGTVVNGTVNGTVGINTTTGTFTGETVLFMTTDHGNFAFNQVNPSTGFYDGFVYATFANGSSSVYLEINVPTLVGYTGGSLCTNAARCPDGNLSALFESNGTVANFLTGSLTPAVATTPEPSSLVLLGTGALGIVGSLRRRFLKA